MGTISVTLPSDGQTADAADYNVPINTIVSEINGSLNSANIAASGVVPNSLISGTGTSWAWQSWTPTWTNLTVSGSTVVAKYTQIGKTVFARVSVVLGGGNAPTGSVSFSLPVTSVTIEGGSNIPVIGESMYYDGSTALSKGYVSWTNTTTALLQAQNAAGTYILQANLSSTIPFAWNNSDVITALIVYEAA